MTQELRDRGRSESSLTGWRSPILPIRAAIEARPTTSSCRVSENQVTAEPSLEWCSGLIPPDDDLLPYRLRRRRLRGRRPIQSCGGDVADQKRQTYDDDLRRFHERTPLSAPEERMPRPNSDGQPVGGPNHQAMTLIIKRTSTWKSSRSDQVVLPILV